MKKLLFLLLFLCGCEAPIQSGTVYNKEIRPPWDETIDDSVTIHISEDSSITIPSSHVEHHPESYSVEIENNFDEEHNRWRTRKVWVSKQRFDQLKIDDWLEVK